MIRVTRPNRKPWYYATTLLLAIVWVMGRWQEVN